MPQLLLQLLIIVPNIAELSRHSAALQITNFTVLPSILARFGVLGFWGFMVFQGSRLFFYFSRSVFMVFQGSRFVFHGSKWVFMVFQGFRLVFRGPFYTF